MLDNEGGSSQNGGSYEVLARRTRPQTFAEVIGQDHVTQTLVNALATGRVAHGFVFSGMRGVGKTTTARILAKALNCEKGPTADPCNECESCVEITEGRSLDVMEVDAASQTGIDAARELLETVKYQPASGRYRVYIIDEAHGLSKQAVDAFLKTLEEPPPHVKFILATTAAHKLSSTILSRCQRYDFRAVPLEQIVEALSAMVEKEGMQADEDAVRSVARESGGSLRDATSLLDQVLAFADGRLDAAAVEMALGLPDGKAVREMVAAVIARDPARCLEILGEVTGQGGELTRFAQECLQRIRNLTVLKTAGRVALADLAKSEIAELEPIAESVDLEDLQRWFRILLTASDETGRTGQPRLVLEMALVQMATLPKIVPIDQLVERLERIERGGGGGGGTGGGGGSRAPAPAPARGGGPGRGSPPPRRRADASGSPARQAQPAPAPAPLSSGTAPRSGQAPAEATASVQDQDRWKQVVARLQREKASRYFRLSYSKLVHVTDDQIHVAVAGKEAAQTLGESSIAEAIETAATDIFARPLRFVPVVDGKRGTGPGGRPSHAALDKEARQDPVVQMSVEMLEGRVEAVMPRSQREG